MIRNVCLTTPSPSSIRTVHLSTTSRTPRCQVTNTQPKPGLAIMPDKSTSTENTDRKNYRDDDRPHPNDPIRKLTLRQTAWVLLTLVGLSTDQDNIDDVLYDLEIMFEQQAKQLMQNKNLIKRAIYGDQS